MSSGAGTDTKRAPCHQGSVTRSCDLPLATFTIRLANPIRIVQGEIMQLNAIDSWILRLAIRAGSSLVSCPMVAVAEAQSQRVLYAMQPYSSRAPKLPGALALSVLVSTD